jgi:hypothetical protein
MATPAPAPPKVRSELARELRSGSSPQGGAGAGALPDEVRVRAHDVAADLAQHFAWAHRVTGQGEWPAGCCVEASFCLLEELEQKVPEAGAEYVVDAGELADGHVDDRSVAQLDPGVTRPAAGDQERAPDVVLIAPGQSFAERYDVGARGLPGRKDSE